MKSEASRIHVIASQIINEMDDNYPDLDDGMKSAALAVASESYARALTRSSMVALLTKTLGR